MLFLSAMNISLLDLNGMIGHIGLVFGSPVSRLEKDRNWTRPRLIGLEIHRTAKDQDCSLVCGPLPF